MTTTRAFLDTWAWWEIVLDTPEGRRLEARFVRDGEPHTSAWALGELAAKLALHASADRVAAGMAHVRQVATVHDVTAPLAVTGAALRQALRTRAPRASLGDGVMLATARHLGMKLVSADAAFVGQPDVVR